MARHKKVGRKPLPPVERKKRKIERLKAYQIANTKLVNFRLNVETDKDIIEKLDSVENKAGYIKNLIRKDITK